MQANTSNQGDVFVILSGIATAMIVILFLNAFHYKVGLFSGTISYELYTFWFETLQNYLNVILAVIIFTGGLSYDSTEFKGIGLAVLIVSTLLILFNTFMF